MVIVVVLMLPAVFPPRPAIAVVDPPSIAPEVVTSYQPDRPITATFIYLWQKNVRHDGIWRYWNDRTSPTTAPPVDWNSRFLPDIDTTVFDPSTELYSGQDVEAQRWIVAQLTRARMDVAISSWWGQGHRTDRALGTLMDLLEGPDSPNRLLRVALYYEPEGGRDPGVREIRQDLRYIRSAYASRPSYLRIDGRPVLFVYGADEDGMDMPARWEVAQRLGFFTVLRVFGYGLYRWSHHQPDAWHDYRPAARITATSDAISISPGFFAVNEPVPRLARNPAAFAAASKRALVMARRAGHTFILWTTGNEDGEGTGYFPQTRAIREGTTRVPRLDGQPSDAEVAVLERILPPLPRIVLVPPS